ncbi:MAG: CehA/McbA family metallohydrolase [Atribacterota bacterium]|nr:CehA/McbA family metallohydrolase [Atribacterota bacterium]
MPVYTKTFTPSENKTLTEFIVPVIKGTKEILLKGDYHPKSVNDIQVTHNLIGQAVYEYLRFNGKDSVFFGPNWDYYQDNYKKNAIKLFSPIRNLFNYTLIDPNGIVRARGNNNFFKTIQITKEEVSIGCVPGALPAGDWRLIVEAHAVISELVILSIEVNLNQEFTQGVKTTEKCQAELRDLDRKEPLFREERESSGWFGGDFHIHSHHSDGNHSVYELMTYLQGKGLDFFVLSDHNTTLGWKEKYLSKTLVIPGIEISTFFGHFVLINWVGDINWFSLERESTFEDVAAEIKRKGALFSVAHPACIGDPICTGCRWDYPNFCWGAADVIEVWAGSWSERRAENIKTLKRWENLLNQGLKVIAVSGSDIHQLEPYKKDYGRTYVWAKSKTREGIMEGLKEGKVYITSGPKINFQLMTDKGVFVSLGEELEVDCNTSIKLLINIENKKTKKKLHIELIKNGLVFNSYDFFSEHIELDWSDKVIKNCWYYLRLLDQRKCIVGLTNPIFVICH